jgi:hypothetical protein
MVKLCLASVSGDMSRFGMSSTNKIIPIDWKDRYRVAKFLDAQNKLQISFMFCSDYGSSFVQNRSKKFWNLFHELKDSGVFSCKWDARTVWSMEYFYEDELQNYEPWEVE